MSNRHAFSNSHLTHVSHLEQLDPLLTLLTYPTWSPLLHPRTDLLAHQLTDLPYLLLTNPLATDSPSGLLEQTTHTPPDPTARA